MLFDPARHESLTAMAWDADRVRAAITAIAADTEARYVPTARGGTANSPAADGSTADGSTADRPTADRLGRPGADDQTAYWPIHPLDLEAGDDPDLPATSLYFGACGVAWALHRLQDVGAIMLSRDYRDDLDALVARNRRWLASEAEQASYLMGDVPILMLAFGARPDAALAERLAALIAANIDHPARELMWGAPGTLLAAAFLHERTGDARWSMMFRRTAERLWSQLEWSSVHACHYWTQDLYGRRSTYLDAVHGFVATASVLIRGRRLLPADAWSAWSRCIADTVTRTASHEGALVNWRPELDTTGGMSKMLLQFCHGAPGFVICLADFPGPELDALLLAAGETIWTAGPLVKGSNLCHGTGGNGYAFLKLYRRTGDTRWLDRARAFAMHGIAQAEAAARRHGQGRYSLWTGDLGLAIYLWDCLHGSARFPTLDVFYPG
ncbi:MAG: LanC-like protein [Casimicrobiaceae bacterium]